MGKDWLDVFPSAGTKLERDAALHTANFLTNVPEFLWGVIPYGPKALADKAVHEIKFHATKMIHQIREQNLEGDSMLHFLARHESNLPENEIIDELLSLTMAGHESKTLCHFRFTLAHLSFPLSLSLCPLPLSLSLSQPLQIHSRLHLSLLLSTLPFKTKLEKKFVVSRLKGSKSPTRRSTISLTVGLSSVRL
jgi:hypothetical protein